MCPSGHTRRDHTPVARRTAALRLGVPTASTVPAAAIDPGGVRSCTSVSAARGGGARGEGRSCCACGRRAVLPRRLSTVDVGRRRRAVLRSLSSPDWRWRWGGGGLPTLLFRLSCVVCIPGSPRLHPRPAARPLAFAGRRACSLEGGCLCVGAAVGVGVGRRRPAPLLPPPLTTLCDGCRASRGDLSLPFPSRRPWRAGSRPTPLLAGT